MKRFLFWVVLFLALSLFSGPAFARWFGPGCGAFHAWRAIADPDGDGVIVPTDGFDAIAAGDQTPDISDGFNFYTNNTGASIGPVATIAFVDSNPDTITDSGNGFVAAGFTNGMTVTVSCPTCSPNNNGTYLVTTVAAGVITLDASEELTADAAGDNVTITGDVSITAFDYGGGAITEGAFKFIGIGDSNTTFRFDAGSWVGHGGVIWEPTAGDFLIVNYKAALGGFLCGVSRPTRFEGGVFGGFTASQLIGSDSNGNLDSVGPADIYVTANEPDLMDSRDYLPIWTNTTGHTVTITGIYAISDDDDTDFRIEEYDADGTSNESLVKAETCDTGSGPYTNDAQTTITNPTIEDGHILVLDFDDTDTPDYLHIAITRTP